jgi:hypothetical protein
MNFEAERGRSIVEDLDRAGLGIASFSWIAEATKCSESVLAASEVPLLRS